MSEFERTVVGLLATIAGTVIGIASIIIYEFGWRRR
jgi:hypothetical protein